MSLDNNKGSMTTGTNSTMRIRDMDPKVYQRMANRASFVALLRLMGFKASSKAVGRSGYAIGKKSVNCGSFKFEWADIFPGSPLSAANGAVNTTGKTLNVPTGNGSMFQANDLILNRNTGEQMLVTSVTADALTVVRGWGTSTQAVSGLDIGDGDVIILLCNAFSEGTQSPEARSYNPTEAYNYTQIFKRAVENTGTNEATKYYGNVNKLDFQKEEELYQFMLERSRAYFKGNRVEFTDVNGKKKRTTAGLDSFITSNIFIRNTFTYGNFMDFAEMAYGYGGAEKILVCNPALATLVEKEVLANKIKMDVSPKTKEFGIKIDRLSTIHGSMDMMIDLTMKDLYNLPTGFALETPLIEEMILRPDIWKENVQANDLDGRKDLIFGEAGLKVISEQRHAKIIVDPAAEA